MTLSFVCVWVLAQCISDLLERLKSELDVECVTLCGSMFEHKKFSNLAFARARASLKVAYNKELPIDN